jgi:hypothetical protein
MRPFNERFQTVCMGFFIWLTKGIEFQTAVCNDKKDWMVEFRSTHSGSEEDNSLAFYFVKGILQEMLDWIDCHYRYTLKENSFIEGHENIHQFLIGISQLD